MLLTVGRALRPAIYKPGGLIRQLSTLQNNSHIVSHAISSQVLTPGLEIYGRYSDICVYLVRVSK